MYQSICQTGTPLNIPQLNGIVAKLYNPQTQESERVQIDSALSKFRAREDLSLYLSQVLQSDSSLNTKFIVASAVSTYISKSWMMLSQDQQNDLKTFLWEYCQSDGIPDVILGLLDKIIVIIACFEYTNKWSSFVQDLLSVSSKSDFACVNVLHIFKLFSEEISEFAENSMTSATAGEILNVFSGELQGVINLISNCLQSQNPVLIKAAFGAFENLVKWIDPSFFFETNLLNAISLQFLPDKNYTDFVVRILGEVISLNYIPEEYQQNLIPIFMSIVEQLKPLLDDDMSCISKSISGLLAETLPSFFEQYSEIIENQELSEAIQLVLQVILKYTSVCENDVFTDCADFWYKIAQKIYSEIKNLDSIVVKIYSPIIPQLKRVLINRIVSPFEFDEYKEEDGSITRKIKSLNNYDDLFSTIKTTLSYLTEISPQDTVQAINSNKNEIVQGNLTRETLNSLCWSIGAVIPSLSEQTDKLSVHGWIEWLISCFNSCNNREIHNILGINICFIIGQSGKFLLRDDAFFDNVINWLLGLMSDNDFDIKASSIDCLRKISKTNNDQMIKKPASGMSKLEFILSNFGDIISSLNEEATIMVFEFTGTLIKYIGSEDVKRQMFHIVVSFLDKYLKEILSNFDCMNPELCHKLTFICKCNIALASDLGNFYLGYFMTILNSLMNLFNEIIAAISQASENPTPNEYVILSSMRVTSDSIILLMEKAIEFSFNNMKFVKNNIFPLCFSEILDHFYQTPPKARSPKLIALFGALASKCPDEFSANYQLVFTKLYNPVLSMIQKNFDDFPEFRSEFFIFMEKLTYSCFNMIMRLPPDEFDTFLESIKFGTQHYQIDVCEKSTYLLSKFLDLMRERLQPDELKEFSQKYFVSLLLFSFKLLSNTSLKFAFSGHVNLIRSILLIPGISVYAETIIQQLYNEFPMKSPSELFELLQNLCQNISSPYQFKEILKDFLISVSHLLPHDPDLITKEKEELTSRVEEAANGNTWFKKDEDESNF